MVNNIINRHTRVEVVVVLARNFEGSWVNLECGSLVGVVWYAIFLRRAVWKGDSSRCTSLSHVTTQRVARRLGERED